MLHFNGVTLKRFIVESPSYPVTPSQIAAVPTSIVTALSAYSGKPVNVTTGNDENHDGLALDRPGGVPRNRMHGPSFIGFDLNLSHDLPLTKDGAKGPLVSLGLNSFNVLNHPNYATYVGVVGSPFFGHAVAAQPPRRLQLNLEIKF